MEAKLTSVPMNFEQRSSYLLMVLKDLVQCLRARRPIGSKVPTSNGAARHGIRRFHQQYTAPMLVEESRLLQVSIFHALQLNLANIDYSVLLSDVMAIADEIDFQLSQAIESFSDESYQSATA